MISNDHQERRLIIAASGEDVAAIVVSNLDQR